MATRIWRGDAQATFHTQTVTIAGTWATNDTATLTINGKDLTVTVGAAVATTDVAAAIKAAFAGDAVVGTETRNTTGPAIVEFARITATVIASVVTLTANDAGVPFTLTATESTAGSGTATAATTVTATGPNHYDNAENWVGGAVPVNGDDIIFEASTVSVLYGLDQSAVAPASVRVRSTFTGRIGLPVFNDLGYFEYRQRTLVYNGCTSFVCEAGDGAGSGRLIFGFGTGAVSALVDFTGAPVDQGIPSLLISGSNAGNVLNATKGSIGLAFEAGTTAQFPTVRIGSQQSAADVVLKSGTGATLATIIQAGGDLSIRSNVTTLTQTDGTYTQYEGTLGTVVNEGATIFSMGTGTITSLTCRGQRAIFNRERTPQAITITNASFTGGAAFLDIHESVTWSNAFTFDDDSRAASRFGKTVNLLKS